VGIERKEGQRESDIETKKKEREKGWEIAGRERGCNRGGRDKGAKGERQREGGGDREGVV
jgi:hypothetical protein